MSTNSKARALQISADQALIAGVQKYLASYPSLSVDGQSLTPAGIVQLLQNRVDASQAVQPAEAAHHAAVVANRAMQAQTAAARRALCQIVQGMFANSPDTLAVFGLKPRKASSETTATRAAALLKAEATRKARGTLGSKQKLKITGANSPAPSPSNGSSPAPATPAPAKT
jgi:hypothetical protein